MARPQLTTIEHSQESWDSDINDNNAILVDGPFPVVEVADVATLNGSFPANMFDRCIAAVIAPPGLYLSDGASWIKLNDGGGFSAIRALYVGKHGNDANSGASNAEAFLTFGAALAAAAGLTPAAGAEVAIVCDDPGVYTENLVIPPFVRVHAPYAEFVGDHQVNEDTRFVAGILTVATTNAIVHNGGGGTAYVEADIIRCTGAQNGIIALSPSNVVVANVKQAFVENGIAFGDVTTSVGHIHVRCGDIYVSGAGGAVACFFLGSGIVGRVDHILKIGAGTGQAFNVAADGNVSMTVDTITTDTGIVVNGANAFANLRVGQMNCPTLTYDVLTGATLQLQLGTLASTSGPQQETSGQVRLVHNEEPPSAVITWRPGAVAPLPQGVYSDFARAYAALQRYEGDGRALVVDDSLVTPAVVPAGNYDFRGIETRGTNDRGNINVVMEVGEGVVITDALRFNNLITIRGTATATVPMRYTNPPLGAVPTIFMERAAFWENQGTVPMLEVDQSGVTPGSSPVAALQFNLDKGATIQVGTFPAVSVRDATTLQVAGLDLGALQTNALQGTALASLVVFVVSANAFFSMSAIHAAFLGTIVGPIFADRAAGMAYTPSAVGNWSGVAPNSIGDALDRIAASIGPIP